MSSRLYLALLPNAQTTTSDEGVAAEIQQSGLLQQGGTATEKIAAENIDLVINGQWRYGETFSQKLADELESLGESDYSGIPFYDPDASDSGRNKGYYELESVDVNPAHPTTRDTYEYQAALTFTGTKQTHWRAVETNVETINTGLATGSGGLIAVPSTAGKVKWYDKGQGTEPAEYVGFVDSEFGTLRTYDPDASTYSNPTLIYEISFADESGRDVRVWDDLNGDKYVDIKSGGGDYDTGAYDTGVYGGTLRATQWVHAFHTAFEFDGRPVVDNGRLRITFDESAQSLEFSQWDENSVEFVDATPTQDAYELVDADFERIGPAMVDVYVEFQSTSDGSLATAVLSIQRGLSEVVVREPDNGTIPSDLESMLDPIASDQTTDAQPSKSLATRNEVK